MLKLLCGIPAGRQTAIARSLLPVAGIATVCGLVLTGLGIAGGETVKKCTGHLVFKNCKDVYEDWSLATSVFLIAAGIGSLVIAVVSLGAALRLFSMQGHLKRYLAILTGVESIGVEKIADITGSRPSRVRGRDSGHDQLRDDQ